jgi:hypothetical protein
MAIQFRVGDKVQASQNIYTTLIITRRPPWLKGIPKGTPGTIIKVKKELIGHSNFYKVAFNLKGRIITMNISPSVLVKSRG